MSEEKQKSNKKWNKILTVVFTTAVVFFGIDYIMDMPEETIVEEDYVEIEMKRVLQFEMPDGVIMKLSLNGTDKGYYNLFESSINYHDEQLMLKDLKLLSDDFVKFNKTDNSKIEVEFIG